MKKPKRSIGDIVADEMRLMAGEWSAHGSKLITNGPLSGESYDTAWHRGMSYLMAGQALGRHEVFVTLAQRVENAAKKEGYKS